MPTDDSYRLPRKYRLSRTAEFATDVAPMIPAEYLFHIITKEPRDSPASMRPLEGSRLSSPASIESCEPEPRLQTAIDDICEQLATGSLNDMTDSV